MAAPAPKPPRQRRGRFPRLTRRAKHRHNGIIEKLIQPARDASAAGFFAQDTLNALTR
jgi:hypothetical protein